MSRGKCYDACMELLVALLMAAAALAADPLDVFGRAWSVPTLTDWVVSGDDGGRLLQLRTSRGPLPGPRRPIQFALTEVPSYHA